MSMDITTLLSRKIEQWVIDVYGFHPSDNSLNDLYAIINKELKSEGFTSNYIKQFMKSHKHCACDEKQYQTKFQMNHFYPSNLNKKR